jgi:hypothetical protein
MSMTDWGYRRKMRLFMQFSPVGSCALSIAMFGSMFWASDDAGYAVILSGAFSGSPSSHIPFMGQSFSSLVRLLYQINSNVSWYPIVIIGIPLVAACALLGRVASRQQVPHVMALLSVNFGIAVLATHPNFTFSCMLTTSITLSWILLDTASFTWIRRFGYLMFLVVGFSIRSEVRSTFVFAFLAVFVSSVVVLAFQLVEKGRARTIRILFLVVGALVVMQPLNWLQMRNDQEYREFVDFNSARIPFNDFNVVQRHVTELARSGDLRKFGIDPLSLKLLDDFEAFDEGAISTDSLMRLNYDAFSSLSADDVARIVGSLGTFMTQLPVLTLLWGASVIAFGLRMARSRVLVGTVVIYTLVVLHVLTQLTKPDPRVLWGATFAVMISLSAFRDGALSDSAQSRNSNWWSRSAVAIGIGVAVPLILLHGAERPLSNREFLSSRGGELRDFLAETSSYTSIAWIDPGVFGSAYMPIPFDQRRMNLIKHSRVVFGGTMLRSPLWRARFEMLRGDGTPITNLFSESLIERVIVDPHRAAYIRMTAWAERRHCYGIYRTQEENWVRLVTRDKKDCTDI